MTTLYDSNLDIREPSHERRIARLAMFFKERRFASGLSQGQVALALELSPDEFQHFETGQRPIPLDDIFCLTNLLNIPPEDVLSLIFDTYVSGQQK